MTREIDTVEAQVGAYNSRDITRFAAFYSEDIEIFDFPDTVILKGKSALVERYAKRFSESEDLRATILHRFSNGSYVVDIEEITGAAFGAGRAAVIYQVSGDRIIKAWFIRNASI